MYYTADLHYHQMSEESDTILVVARTLQSTLHQECCPNFFHRVSSFNLLRSASIPCHDFPKPPPHLHGKAATGRSFMSAGEVCPSQLVDLLVS